MNSIVLPSKKATRSNVLKAMRAAAKALAAGDLFFMTHSGHGGQVPDVSGDEADKQDETWCRRLSAIVKRFEPAVVLISGCQDNQTSMDGEHNVHARIRASMPASQSPNLFTLGQAGTFLAQVPFTV